MSPFQLEWYEIRQVKLNAGPALQQRKVKVDSMSPYATTFKKTSQILVFFGICSICYIIYIARV